MDADVCRNVASQVYNQMYGQKRVSRHSKLERVSDQDLDDYESALLECYESEALTADMSPKEVGFVRSALDAVQHEIRRRHCEDKLAAVQQLIDNQELDQVDDETLAAYDRELTHCVVSAPSVLASLENRLFPARQQLRAEQMRRTTQSQSQRPECTLM